MWQNTRMKFSLTLVDVEKGVDNNGNNHDDSNNKEYNDDDDNKDKTRMTMTTLFFDVTTNL